jgi:hypothetical protein
MVEAGSLGRPCSFVNSEWAPSPPQLRAKNTILGVPDPYDTGDETLVLYCENGHRKNLSNRSWAEWKFRHGPFTVMLCRKCSIVLVPENEIPEPYLKWIREHGPKDES